jgi:hypothetical protein
MDDGELLEVEEREGREREGMGRGPLYVQRIDTLSLLVQVREILNKTVLQSQRISLELESTV